MAEPERQSEEFTFHPIGVVRSVFKAKFGIPRQPGLIPEAVGQIVLQPPYNQPNIVRGLEQFSHIWVLFVFHLAMRDNWKATVRPPRLGGDKRIGVFASRSPFRPNPVGLSVLRLKEVCCRNGKVWLEVQGLDLLDGTPVLDIKPYIPYADSLSDASGGFADAPPEQTLQVTFTEHAATLCQTIERCSPGFTELARKVVAENPRPAYQDIPGREYGIFLGDYEVVWQADGPAATILDIRPGKKTR